MTEESQNPLIETLHKKLERTLTELIQPGEQVFVKLRGVFKEALVCTDTRIIILKAGFMAGQPFRLNIFQCPYRSVAGVQVKGRVMTGIYFELSTNEIQNTPKSDMGSRRAGSSAADPNCVSISNSKRAEIFKQACTFIMQKSAVSPHELRDVFMACSKCGAEVEQDAKFCSNCGTKCEKKVSTKWAKVFVAFAFFFLIIVIVSIIGGSSSKQTNQSAVSVSQSIPSVHPEQKVLQDLQSHLSDLSGLESSSATLVNGKIQLDLVISPSVVTSGNNYILTTAGTIYSAFNSLAKEKQLPSIATAVVTLKSPMVDRYANKSTESVLRYIFRGEDLVKINWHDIMQQQLLDFADVEWLHVAGAEAAKEYAKEESHCTDAPHFCQIALFGR